MKKGCFKKTSTNAAKPCWGAFPGHATTRNTARETGAITPKKQKAWPNYRSAKLFMPLNYPPVSCR